MSDPAITAEAAAEGGRVLALRVLEQAILDATSALSPAAVPGRNAGPWRMSGRTPCASSPSPMGNGPHLAGPGATWRVSRPNGSSAGFTAQRDLLAGGARNEVEPGASPEIRNNGL